MAYNQKGLAVVNPGGVAGAVGVEETKRVLSYHTNDDAATVQTANYFPAAAQLRKGDIILAGLDVDGATPVGKMYIVTAAPVGLSPAIALFTTT
jgi:hypothetical protein